MRAVHAFLRTGGGAHAQPQNGAPRRVPALRPLQGGDRERGPHAAQHQPRRAVDTEWIDACQTPATRKKRNHEQLAKEELKWLKEEGARLHEAKNAKIEHKRLRLEQRAKEQAEMNAHACAQGRTCRRCARPAGLRLHVAVWMQLNPDWSMEEMNTDERREFNQQRAHVTSLLRRCFPELIERVNALEADKVRREKEKRKAKREQQKQARDAWLVRSNARAGTRTRPTFCSSAPTCSWSTHGAAL